MTRQAYVLTDCELGFQVCSKLATTSDMLLNPGMLKISVQSKVMSKNLPLQLFLYRYKVAIGVAVDEISYVAGGGVRTSCGCTSNHSKNI